MRRSAIMRAAVAMLAVATPFGPAANRTAAATPPASLNYQGVLRDAGDKPLSGNYDITLTLWDAPNAGNQVLVDAHTGAGSVSVSGGLFNCTVGGGTVTDGSGPGVYTSLADVFRDYGNVWLEVRVGTETLAPRTQVLAEAYALNATNLGGKGADAFLDLSSTPQTKVGTATFDAVAAANSSGLEARGSVTGGHFRTSGTGEIFGGHGDTGLDAYGAYAGGIFRHGTPASYDTETYLATDAWGLRGGGSGVRGGGGGLLYDQSDPSTYAYLSWSGYGVVGQGSAAGGYFTDPGVTTWAKCGYDGYGVYSRGTRTGVAAFTGTNFATLADEMAGTGVSASGRTIGVSASSGTLVTRIADSGTGYGVLASGGTVGVYGQGATLGAQFQRAAPALEYANLAASGYGIQAYGTFDQGGAGGGMFSDVHYSGYAELAVGNNGVFGSGSYFGGRFVNRHSGADAWLGYANVGIAGYARNSGEAGGFFQDLSSSGWAYLGKGAAKIQGTGAVSFVQNHPLDRSRVIVYAAPEGDEVAVYTRGTGRLSDGRARVLLGETFQWVVNPDLGLTAHLTPRDEPVALAVTSVSPTELAVRGPAGSNAEFDYLVFGLRIGFEDRPVVRPKEREAFIPDMAEDRRIFAAQPDLHSYTALQRFLRQRTPRVTDPGGATDLAASRALEAQIVRYDPARHSSLLGAPDVNRKSDIEQRGGDPTAVDSPNAARVQQPPGDARLAGQVALASTSTSTTPAVDPPWPAATSPVPVSEPVAAGDVVVIDPAHAGSLVRSSHADDDTVVGIVAGERGTTWSGTAPIALAGSIAFCNVDATGGPVAAGDLLVTSPMPGFATAPRAAAAAGTVVGKALEPLPGGSGPIRVLVMSR